MSPSAASEPPLQQGRTDPLPLLAQRLGRAGSAYLEGAVENPALNEDLAVALLRNRRATADILRRLHDDRRFRRSVNVRVGLVCHPATPRATAMNLVPYLPWRHLAEVADRPLAPAPVRRSALRYLEERYQEMALGEQTQLARTAGRSVLTLLARRGDEPVVRAALDNPRFTEDDLVAVCSRQSVAPEVLELVARNPKWTRRYRVRQALVHHARAPLGVVLGLLTGLLRSDLEAVAQRPDRPAVVRLAALRILRKRRRGAPPPRKEPDVYVLDPEEAEAP